MNRCAFLTDTYATERLKILAAWAMFRDSEMNWRPEVRGRSVHEQMVHQCVSEHNWMKNFFGIEVQAPHLPENETRAGFIHVYAESQNNVSRGLSPCPSPGSQKKLRSM